MFRRILIANRGEIALRIIRACREMEIESVAVYSEPDRDSLPVAAADRAICIGPGNSSRSYLNIPALISAAEVADVEAIHPGYGFLSEDSHFAEICESCNITFIGPQSAVLALLGDKEAARGRARQAGLPIIPGGDEIVEDERSAVRVARRLGYPLMIKAVAGGGGKGMRAVHNDVSLAGAFLAARKEASGAFGNPGVYLEKLIDNPRHIEVQILADERGNAVSLGERDCTVQRNHQKLIEEALSPVVDSVLRQRLTEMALRLVKKVGYSGAGTVEFLLDSGRNCYFLEMNGRIQVEHPVTEMITGIDLVKAQIRLAAGEKLPVRKKDISFRGHCLECRINAEDPSRGFAPSPGTVTSFQVPGGPGVRVDTHIYPGASIPPFYDSLLAKLITFGPDRYSAIRVMDRALAEVKIEGVKTTVSLLRSMINQSEFIDGDYGTDFLGLMIKKLKF